MTGEVIRDPLWNAIRLDEAAVRIVDSPAFQRLRYIRQLGLAYLVYPGATHTRFDHALGVHHLARRALGLLEERGQLEGVDPIDRELIPLAALLHDIGHYPFSHALEELDPRYIPGDHEALVGRFLRRPELRSTLERITPDGPARIEAMIRGRSETPLQGLVSGSLDLDKIEYLTRDAFFCGVPYGAVDVDRLLGALTLVHDPDTGRREIGILEKGVSALESLLFSKYQMFRNVYWHHAVRAATVLYKRAVHEALGDGLLVPDELIGRSDEDMLSLLERRAEEGSSAAAARLRDRWMPALRSRRLPKRALEMSGGLVRDLPLRWISEDHDLVRRVEHALARRLDLPEGGVLLDYPEKPRMMGLDLLLDRRGEAPVRLGEGGRTGMIDLPRVADELYHTARVLRVFTVERRQLDADELTVLLRLEPEELRLRLEGDDAPHPSTR